MQSLLGLLHVQYTDKRPITAQHLQQAVAGSSVVNSLCKSLCWDLLSEQPVYHMTTLVMSLYKSLYMNGWTHAETHTCTRGSLHSVSTSIPPSGLIYSQNTITLRAATSITPLLSGSLIAVWMEYSGLPPRGSHRKTVEHLAFQKYTLTGWIYWS